MDDKSPFTHIDATESQIEAMRIIRESAESLSHAIASGSHASRYRSLAMEALEECVMWANKSVTHS